MKKLISLIITAAMAVCPAASFAKFPDVSEYSASYRAINELEQLKIIDGDEDGNFNPNRLLTRAEFTKLIVAALGESDAAHALTETSFADCKGHWAAGYIEIGTADGFIDGYDNDKFGPDDTVTYAQAVKMLVSAIGYTDYAENQGGWPAGYITYGTKLGITKSISGATNNTKITRELAAVLIDNAIKIPIRVMDYNSSGERAKTMDGKEGRDYETLLTNRHNAYIVKGKVIETKSINKGLSINEVTYQVETSDNFDGKAYTKAEEPVRMNVGNTDAKDYLFYYTEAIVQKDETSDEYTILTINEK